MSFAPRRACRRAGFLIVAAGLLSSAALGQMRVASVDVVKVYNDYQRQRDLQDQLRAVQERLQAENDQRRQKIEQLQAQVDAMQPTDPNYNMRARELLALQIDYKNWAEINQAALTREVGVWTAELYKDILKAVAEIAEKENFDMVFYRDEFDPQTVDPQQIREQIRNRKLLYARNSTDLTQKLVEKLNADYKAQPPRQMLNMPSAPPAAPPSSTP